MYELRSTDFRCAVPVFHRLKNHTALHAIFERHAPSRLFVNHMEAPTAAFVWNDFRYSYLAGDTGNSVFIVALAERLRDVLLPEAKYSSDPTLVLYPDSPEWEQHLPFLLSGRHFLPLTRHRFVFPLAHNSSTYREADIPAGCQLRRIDADLLADDNEIAKTINLLWCSQAVFLSHGFGYCLMEGSRILSACITAFVGGGQAELDVYTHPDYRRHGLAMLTAKASLEHSLSCRFIPMWECWADNTPSIKLAEKLGFRSVGDYRVYFVPPES